MPTIPSVTCYVRRRRGSYLRQSMCFRPGHGTGAVVRPGLPFHPAGKQTLARVRDLSQTERQSSDSVDDGEIAAQSINSKEGVYMAAGSPAKARDEENYRNPTNSLCTSRRIFLRMKLRCEEFVCVVSCFFPAGRVGKGEGHPALPVGESLGKLILGLVYGATGLLERWARESREGGCFCASCRGVPPLC